MNLTPAAPITTAAVPPVGDDAVDVSVEITPLNTECLASCPVTDQPPALPATGGEPLSLVLPVALFVAGIAAAFWARRSPLTDAVASGRQSGVRRQRR